MKRLPQIKAVMTPFPYSIDHFASLQNASEQMREHDIRHLPVIRDGQLIGILSERDIAVHMDNPGLRGDGQESTVGDLTISEAYVVDLKESLDNVLFHMAQRHLDCVLVTRKGKLVGLFTVTDACRAFGEHLRRQFLPDDGNDAA